MLHTKLRGNRSTGSREKDFEGFCHIWAWWPSWSCDQHHFNKFSIPCTQNLVKNGPVVSETSFNFHM